MTGEPMEKLKIWDWVSTAIFLLGAILFCFGCIRTERFDNFVSATGIAFVSIAILISIIKQRCPFCKHYLGFFFNSKHAFCPYCGSKINRN